MTIEQIIKALQDRNLNEVSRQTGIHVVTLSRIKNGHHRNPRYETVTTLATYLKSTVE